jgi:hypothetical protein
MFPKRGYVPPEFGRLSFQILVYALTRVQSVGLNCNFNKLPVLGSFAIIILVFVFLYRL